MTQYGVILFKTTSLVMQVEKLLLQAGYEIKVIATPRQFSNNCGISVRFAWDNAEEIKLLLNKEKIDFTTIQSLCSVQVKNL